jgi:hypothetical protein
LKAVIADQEAELALYLEDHHNYLLELEKLKEPYHFLRAERVLLLEFNE